MNVAFVEHAENDVDSHEGRQNQEWLVDQGDLKCLRRSLKAGLNARGQLEFLLDLVDGGHSIAQGSAGREIKRHRDDRKLPLVVYCEGSTARLQMSERAKWHGSTRTRLHVEMA